MAERWAFLIARQRHFEEAARQRAEMTPEQRERQDAEIARQNAEIASAARQTDREEARRLASENRAEGAASPEWRDIAEVGMVNEQGVYVREMIDVDARSWQTEPGEHVEVLMEFVEPFPPDFSLRLSALAMEMTARQVEDETLDHVMLHTE